MARRLAVLFAALMIVAVPASAEARSLSIAEAKELAARKAEKVKRDLAGEGAQGAKVPGCWRNNRYKVSCYFSVWGYDRELGMRWKCMLRIRVRLRAHASGRSRYRVTYGRAVCG
jgi:hypothetical protein